MAQTSFAKQQKSIFWLIGIGLLILLLTNALGWIYLQRIKSFLVSDLKFRLENIVNISARLIDANNLVGFSEDDKLEIITDFPDNLPKLSATGMP